MCVRSKGPRWEGSHRCGCVGGVEGGVQVPDAAQALGEASGVDEGHKGRGHGGRATGAEHALQAALDVHLVVHAEEGQVWVSTPFAVVARGGGGPRGGRFGEVVADLSGLPRWLWVVGGKSSARSDHTTCDKTLVTKHTHTQTANKTYGKYDQCPEGRRQLEAPDGTGLHSPPWDWHTCSGDPTLGG